MHAGGVGARRLLALDAASGALRTAARIDREDVAQLDAILVSRQDVAEKRGIESGHAAAVVRVRIRVLDVNDNAPAFPYAAARMVRSFVSWSCSLSFAATRKLNYSVALIINSISDSD